MSKKGVQPRILTPPNFQITKSDDYNSKYATGVYGGVSPRDAFMIFFLDRPEPRMDLNKPGGMQLDHVKRELQVEIHMSPSEFKLISDWMQKHVKQFTEKFGEITAEEGEGHPKHII